MDPAECSTWKGARSQQEKDVRMRPLFTMWSYTRMVVLMALSAALYAAILIPFKFATVIPGLTEIRPGACIPVVTGIMFGPAACWGSALGNVIGDVAGGQFGVGSAFGFVGNFMLSFVAWKLSEAFRVEQGERRLERRMLSWTAICLSASSACALVVGWGVDVLGVVPFTFLGTVVFMNDLVVSLLLGPLLLGVLLPRATRWGLRYRSIMDVPDDRRPGMIPALLLSIASVGGFFALMLIGVGALHNSLLDPTGLTRTTQIQFAGVPFLISLAIAMLML